LNPLPAYKAGTALARYLPAPVSDAVARAVGFGVAHIAADRRALVARHMRRAMGPGLTGRELRRTVDRVFESYARYWLDSFRLPNLSTADVAAGFSSEGYDPHILAGLAAGNGVILALPHLGGWEWAGRWIADQGHPITVVVEPLETPEAFDWFMALRSSLGMTVVPLGPGAASAVLRALRDNHVVCLLSDRDIQGGGVPVEFFGETTTLPGGPATLALRTGAPILPTAAYFTGERDGHIGFVRPPLEMTRTGRLRDDVATLTQALAHELEDLIRRAPEQWHLLQPNWPSDPEYPVSPGLRP
jgi:lauroyl/myristoyl acyltransferase